MALKTVAVLCERKLRLKDSNFTIGSYSKMLSSWLPLNAHLTPLRK